MNKQCINVDENMTLHVYLGDFFEVFGLPHGYKHVLSRNLDATTPSIGFLKKTIGMGWDQNQQVLNQLKNF
jgi:hypothetical protein